MTRPSPKKRRWFRRRRSAQEAPKEPFFRDAKILHGRVRLDVSVRVLLLAIIAFVVTVAAGAVYFIDQNQKLNQAVSDLHDLRDTGHADRLSSEKDIKDSVRELACFFWNFIVSDDDPGAQRIANQIDARYHCVDLHLTPPAGTPRSTPSPSPSTGDRPSATPTPRPTSSSRANAAGPPASGPSSAPRASRSPTAPGTKTVRVTPPPSTATTTPKPKSTGIVDLGPVLCTLKLINC